MKNREVHRRQRSQFPVTTKMKMDREGNRGDTSEKRERMAWPSPFVRPHLRIAAGPARCGTGSSDGEKESQGEVGSKVRVYWY
jgi:hypothetical protein